MANGEWRMANGEWRMAAGWMSSNHPSVYKMEQDEKYIMQIVLDGM